MDNNKLIPQRFKNQSITQNVSFYETTHFEIHNSYSTNTVFTLQVLFTKYVLKEYCWDHDLKIPVRIQKGLTESNLNNPRYNDINKT